MVNLFDEDFTIKKGDTVTREVLNNEVVSETYEYAREINKEPILSEEVVSDLTADQVEEILTLY